MIARSTFSPARKVWSTTAPVRACAELRSHERTALAGLHVLELDDLLNGRRRARASCRSSSRWSRKWPWHQTFWKVCDRITPVGSDQHRIFDSHTSPSGNALGRRCPKSRPAGRQHDRLHHHHVRNVRVALRRAGQDCRRTGRQIRRQSRSSPLQGQIMPTRTIGADEHL